MGLAWIGLEQSAHTLSVTLDAPAQITPRRTLMIPVTVGGGRPGETVRMTLAGVDEGILQLTRYRLPDPLEALFGKRALGVDMRDDYGRLLEGNAQVGTIHAGGDEGEGGAGLAVISSKIVSRFTGPVALDANGHGILRLTIPDFEGQLRLMALAWSPSAVGSTSTDMTVRDPVFADVALPRFLAPGDTAAIAISVANTDAPGRPVSTLPWRPAAQSASTEPQASIQLSQRAPARSSPPTWSAPPTGSEPSPLR